jgi:drug/metabolite transporter (DMT)-like permease
VPAVQAPVAPAHVRRSGQLEAALFVVTIAVLNLSYAGAHAVGAHPVAFLVYAMLIASFTLLALTGPGPEALRIMLSPLSWVVGFGIIGMETLYYLMLWYVTPAEASVLTRLGIPLAMVMGIVIHGRRPRRHAVWGAVIVIAGVAALCLTLQPANAIHGLALALGCALIMNARTFATEFHPWNRSAQTVHEKMRVTGLVLLVTSCAGTLIVLALMAVSATGIIGPSPWLPAVADFLHLPTVLVALLVGAVVLTAMQYFSFSSVVKIGTESFIATTAFTPVATLIAQQAAAAAGVLRPIPMEWQTLPAIAAVVVGVLVILWAGPAQPPAVAERQEC